MNFDAFSHGQIISKVWLCEQLEPWIPKGASITILGGWYNVLGFMLNVRRPNYYEKIESYDITHEATEVADKICNTWVHEHTLSNLYKDADLVQEFGDVVINCSVEHMEGEKWFHNIPDGTTICLQSSNMTNKETPWLIINSNPDIETFVKKYSMMDVLFLDTKRIQYNQFGYDRFMMIGRK